MTFCPVKWLLLSWLGSQIEILKSGLKMRSHLRSQKQGLTMRFQLRYQNHCTFPPRELSRVNDILPSKMPPFSPDWGPKSRSQITTYNEVSFEISETRSYNEVPIEISKPLYFSTMGTVQGRWHSANSEKCPTSLLIEVPNRDPKSGLIMRSHLRSQKPVLTMSFLLRSQNDVPQTLRSQICCTFPPWNRPG
jgi:hypothetical protein